MCNSIQQSALSNQPERRQRNRRVQYHDILYKDIHYKMFRDILYTHARTQRAHVGHCDRDYPHLFEGMQSTVLWLIAECLVSSLRGDTNEKAVRQLRTAFSFKGE